MFATPSFARLETRDDLQRAAQQLLAPLVPYFTPHESGICLGIEFGAHGERAAELETLSRSLWALAPLLAGGGEFAALKRWQTALINGTDPESPGFWGMPVSCDQRQVEQPAIAFSLAAAPQFFWEPLSAVQRKRVSAWLYRTNEVDIVDSNWRWFRVLVNACLRKLGEKWSLERLEEDMGRIEGFHLGGGWYRDENRTGDYYIPMAMQHYALMYAGLAADFDPERARKFRERAAQFAQDFVHWFVADGSAIPFGRSLMYRFAQGSFWGALAFADVEALPWGEIKGLLLRHLRWWLAQPIFSDTGLLTVGYRFPNSAIGESYNAFGSPYWACKALLPLALSADHPFWAAEEKPLPARGSVSVQPHAGMVLCHDERSGHGFALNQGQPIEGWPRHCAHKYGKCAYSATFGFGVAAGNDAARAGLDSTFALSDDGGHSFRLREKCEAISAEGAALISTWKPWPDVEARTWLLPALPGHLRIHRLRSGRPLRSVDAGFAIDVHGCGYAILSNDAPTPCAANEEMGAALIDLHGERRGAVQTHEPSFHLMWFASAFPVLLGEHPPGETWLVTYATGWRGAWTAETLASEAAGWEVECTDAMVRVWRAGQELLQWKH